MTHRPKDFWPLNDAPVAPHSSAGGSRDIRLGTKGACGR